MRGNQSEAVIEGSPRQSLILQLKQKCLQEREVSEWVDHNWTETIAGLTDQWPWPMWQHWHYVRCSWQLTPNYKSQYLKRIFDVRKSLNCHIDRGVKLLLLLGNGRWSSGHDGVGVKGFDKRYYAKLPYWACNEARVVCAFASSVSRSDLNKRFGCFE